MKLRKLHIEDYKMFKDFDISFVDENDEALPIIVLAGVNGSGKTTLLECLAVERERYTLKIDDQGNANFDYEMDFSWFKKYDEIIYLPITEKVLTKPNVIGKEEILNNLEAFFYKEYLKMAKKEDSFVKALGMLQKFIEEIFDGLDLDFKLIDIDTTTEISYFENGVTSELRIHELSSGEKTLLSKVLYLYFEGYKNKVILIDEPELSLHPSWQNKVLKIYENFAFKNNCQIIIATHSPHIIGSAKNEYLRILRKNDEGNIEVVDNSMAYGRDIEWVLEEVMGVQYTREKNILLKIEACEDLIENEEYDKAEEAINNLEDIIGENDSEILSLRNSLAFERIDFEEDN